MSLHLLRFSFASPNRVTVLHTSFVCVSAGFSPKVFCRFSCIVRGAAPSRWLFPVGIRKQRVLHVDLVSAYCTKPSYWFVTGFPPDLLYLIILLANHHSASSYLVLGALKTRGALTWGCRAPEV